MFLLLLEDRFEVRGLLQVAGRMHPLVLHFPLVLIIIYSIYNLFILKKQQVTESTKNYADQLLLLGAFTAVVSALAGLFLSREEGYDVAALQTHKWWGVAVSLFTLCWYYARIPLRRRKITRWLSSITAISFLILAGHAGAGITHGDDFLLAPIRVPQQKSLVALSEAEIFEHVIQPIFESKCTGCHNNSKAKGELILETRALIVKGGKSGVLWDTTHTGESLLLKRLYLPESDKKHMPPKGKPQLSAFETEMLKLWIQKGADFNLKLAELSPDDKLFQLASVLFKTTTDGEYDFEAADAETVQSLNTENRVVQSESLSSPALTVSFFNSSRFQSSQLKDLLKVKEQIVSLDLTRMPLATEDMKTVSQFINLRRLHLGFTPVKSADLEWIKNLQKLQALTLSGTAINASELAILKNLGNLQQLFTWQMPGTESDWQKLEKEMPALRLENGFTGDSIRLKLSPPVLENETTILTQATPLKLKHYIKGVEIRYTLDGSEPDSLRAAVYKGDEMIDKNVQIRAKAYKQGWHSSDLLEAALYKRTYTPDSIRFLTAADASYSTDPKRLTDLIKGTTNFRDGNWVVWRNNRMELLLPFSETKQVSSVTLGVLVDVNSYIMPPLSMEVWGGDNATQLKKLGSLRPEQPKENMPVNLRGYECRFESAPVKYLKIIAQPVNKLPAWHRGKGDKGWLFVDEVLVN